MKLSIRHTAHTAHYISCLRLICICSTSYALTIAYTSIESTTMKNTAKALDKKATDTIHALYNDCKANNESIESINKLHAVCKKHAVNLLDIVTQQKLNKAIYNTICYAEKTVDIVKHEIAVAVKDDKATLYNEISQALESNSRRHITLVCFNTSKCSKQDILNCIDLYADAKYCNMKSANMKCINSVYSQENSKQLTYMYSMQNNKDLNEIVLVKTITK